MNSLHGNLATWCISAISVLGVITRPRNWSEAWWAAGGALALVISSLISPTDAASAVLKGTDVYLFLIGMMMLAEMARREGLFDWLAEWALRHADGSGRKLFLLIYAAGTLVTIFLSNDATAVVLTPAVYAVAKRADVPALPYLLICAFIANAASFVLPVSNPANLVVFGTGMPTLGEWLLRFGPPSLVSILVTYGLLYASQKSRLPAKTAQIEKTTPLSLGGRIAGAGIGVTSVVLLVASRQGWDLGLPTCLGAVAVCLLMSVLNRASPLPMLRGISWSVLPLVAGLFVLVQAVEQTGALAVLTHLAHEQSKQSPVETGLIAGVGVALASNLINNLPMGLIGATVAQSAHLPINVSGALLIGVDLGPNLSITGSLATILWLIALRREGENVSGWTFLKVGGWLMPLSLGATLGVFALLSAGMSG